MLDKEFDRTGDLPSFLSCRYWGHYVSLSESTLGSVQIFRDPSGALPCYFHETSERVVVFSDVDLAIDAGLVEREIDWVEVLTCLAWPGIRTAHTALRGVREIPAGASLGIGGNHYSGLTQIWSPWRFVAPTCLPDVQISERLEATVTGVVRSLASEFERIQLCLSGGLDSSIVAFALAGTETICLNLIANGAEGDERNYADLVARHVGLRLVDQRFRLDIVDVTTSSAMHLPRPVGAAGRLAFDRENLDFAQSEATQAMFTGFGGDNVFCHMRSATPIADRLRSKSVRRGAWQTVVDVCGLTGCSISTALRRAAKKLPRSAARYAWAMEPRFLSREALAAVCDQPAHPWLDAPDDALPGRAAHIAMIMRPQNFAEGFQRQAPIEMINPLLSQPIVELCLPIPSWTWIEGGRDRAPVRAAFASKLPHATIARTTKGGPGGFYRQLADRNRQKIRDQLLEGRLMREGLLDREAVETCLKVSPDTASFPYVRILDLSDAEAWVRHHGSADRS